MRGIPQGLKTIQGRAFGAAGQAGVTWKTANRLRLGLVPVLGVCLGAYALSESGRSTLSCEASQVVYKQVADAHVLQYPANNPIEDRWVYASLKSIPAKLAVVLDGHGGFAVC